MLSSRRDRLSARREQSERSRTLCRLSRSSGQGDFVTISERSLPYFDLNTPLAGLLYRDEAIDAGRPGILLIHGGAGLDDHARQQARRYASLGYVVFACDMFGPGITRNRERVIECLTVLRDDPALLVRRAQAGLAALASRPDTDRRLAAIGFCFGGMAVLAL